MTDTTTVTIEDQISRLYVWQAYLRTTSWLCCCTMWKTISKLCINTHCKSGTIGSSSQTGSTIYIWVTNKVLCIACNLWTVAASCIWTIFLRWTALLAGGAALSARWTASIARRWAAGRAWRWTGRTAYRLLTRTLCCQCCQTLLLCLLCSCFSSCLSLLFCNGHCFLEVRMKTNKLSRYETILTIDRDLNPILTDLDNFIIFIFRDLCHDRRRSIWLRTNI